MQIGAGHKFALTKVDSPEMWSKNHWFFMIFAMSAKSYIVGNLSYKMANLAPTWGQHGAKMESRRAKMEAMLGQIEVMSGLVGHLGALSFH